jgi:predicted SpoU family rRNA methylase
MLEAMSTRPCPDETTIFAILYHELSTQFGNDVSYIVKQLSDDQIMHTISDVFVEFGGITKVGSMTNWQLHVKRELIGRCMARLQPPNAVYRKK